MNGLGDDSEAEVASGDSFAESGNGAEAGKRTDWKVGVGVVLNLAELPVIMIAAGIACGGGAAGADDTGANEAWVLYSRVLLPLLALAACGEALWLGQYHARQL